ncbi:MAG: cell division protein ZapA [Rhizobiaceae bacterium]
MAHVTVTINGKAYRMACDEGQEAHLISLSERFNDYIGQLRESFGEIGDQRLTVMAGVMVIDEMQELEKRVRSLEADITVLKASRDDALGKIRSNDGDMARRLIAAAEKIEALTVELNKPGN